MEYGWNFNISGLKMMMKSGLKKYFWNSSMRSPCHFYYWILIKSTNSVIKTTWWAHGGISKIFFLDHFSSSFEARNAKISPTFHFDRGHQSWICHILCVNKKKSIVLVFLCKRLLAGFLNLALTVISEYKNWKSRNDLETANIAKLNWFSPVSI